MRMLFKQRMFSWLDSYDIFGEDGATLYTVKGQLAWGHCLKVFNAQGQELGMVKENMLTFLPKFEIWRGGESVGTICRELTLLKPKYSIDFKGWHIEGSWTEWNYTILDEHQTEVASVYKELLHWTDTYVIDVSRREDALWALMFVLAIDAEKYSRV